MKKEVIEPCTDRNCVQQTNIALINQSMKNIEANGTGNQYVYFSNKYDYKAFI